MVQQRSLMNLLRVTVSSRLEYGLHLAMCASKTVMEKLQRVQNAAMRIVTGAAKPTACDALRFWLGLNSVRGQQQTAAAQAFLKTLTTPTHPLHEEVVNRRDELVDQRLKTVRSWIVDARKMVEEVTQQENIKEIVWVESDVRVRTARIGGRYWRDRAEEVNMSEVYEWLHQEDPTVVIATDGSLREDITAWGGAVWREGRLCFEWSAAKEGRSSSFRAESEALDALFWLEHNTDRRDKVVILTDSLSLVSKMESGVVRENWLEVIRRIVAWVTVCYIPGHSGLKWNEKADRLAGAAQPIGMVQRTPGDVLSGELGVLTRRSLRNILEGEGPMQWLEPPPL